MQIPDHLVDTAIQALKLRIIDCAAHYIETMRSFDARQCDETETLSKTLRAQPNKTLSLQEREILRTAVKEANDQLQQQFLQKPSGNVALDLARHQTLLQSISA